MAGQASLVSERRRVAGALTVDQIIGAAWDLVDRGGIDALSTRALAAELGVQGPALYWHVSSMQHLFGLMIERALSDSMPEPDPGLSWQEWLQRMCRAQRRALLAHRDSGRIASSLAPTEALQGEIIPRMIAPMLLAGVDRQHAVGAVGALASFVLGWVLYEERRQTRDMIATMIDIEQMFEFSLDALVFGIAAKIPRGAPFLQTVEK